MPDLRTFIRSGTKFVKTQGNFKDKIMAAQQETVAATGEGIGQVAGYFGIGGQEGTEQPRISKGVARVPRKSYLDKLYEYEEAERNGRKKSKKSDKSQKVGRSRKSRKNRS
jgi:hypothetical protein